MRVVSEAVHHARPLECDNRPFQSGQKVERQRDAANREDREQHQRLGPELHEHDVQQRRHQVSDDKDRQIRRSVIRAMMVKLFPADRACIAHGKVPV